MEMKAEPQRKGTAARSGIGSQVLTAKKQEDKSVEVSVYKTLDFSI